MMDLMIENKEFQKLLAQYPDDAVMALCLEYNGVKALFYNVEVEGIQFPCGDKNVKAVIIINKDFNEEYEALLNGGEL